MINNVLRYFGYFAALVTISYSALAGIPTVDIVGATGKLLDDLKAISVTAWVQKEVDLVSGGQPTNIVDFSYPCKIVYQVISTKEVFRLIPESAQNEPVCARDPYPEISDTAHDKEVRAVNPDVLEVPKDVARAYLYVGVFSFLANVFLIALAIFRRNSVASQINAVPTSEAATNE